MLTYEQWREEIGEQQFPMFRERMIAKGIATSCKADSADHTRLGKVGRVTVQARELDTADSFVLTLFHVSEKKISIHMTRFSGQAGGRPRRTELLAPFSDTPSEGAVANAFAVFEGAIFACLKAKIAQLKKSRHQPTGIRDRPGGSGS